MDEAVVDQDKAMTILHDALQRPLTLEEARYLEECIFEGPPTLVGEEEETSFTIERVEVDGLVEWEEWPPRQTGIARTTGYKRSVRTISFLPSNKE